LVRKEQLTEKEKESFFLEQSSVLKNIAELCNCVILAANQVTPVIVSAEGTSSVGGMGSNEWLGDVIFDPMTGMEYVPTLGPTWHHCVTTRVVLSSGYQITSNQHLSIDPRMLRSITIAKSPLVPKLSFPYQITTKGITVVTSDSNDQ